jgi:hypothetical protein
MEYSIKINGTDAKVTTLKGQIFINGVQQIGGNIFSSHIYIGQRRGQFGIKYIITQYQDVYMGKCKVETKGRESIDELLEKHYNKKAVFLIA